VEIESVHRAESAGEGRDTVSVLIVDDHPIVRYGISQLVQQADRTLLSSHTSCCHTAWKAISSARPSVLLMDIDLKDGCAHKLIEKIARSTFLTRVLVYSALAGELQIIDALRSGAHGYITKDAEPEALLRAIHAVYRDGSYLDPAIASKVIGQLGRVQERRASNGRRLTQRECAVLKGLSEGKRNRDIAADLFITERTVKYHLSSMYNKLNVSNRAEAIRFAFEHRFFQ